MSDIPRERGFFSFAEEPSNTVTRRQELRRLEERKFREWSNDPRSLPDIADQYDADGNRRPVKNPYFVRSDVEPKPKAQAKPKRIRVAA